MTCKSYLKCHWQLQGLPYGYNDLAAATIPAIHRCRVSPLVDVPKCIYTQRRRRHDVIRVRGFAYKKDLANYNAGVNWCSIGKSITVWDGTYQVFTATGSIAYVLGILFTNNTQ